MKKLLYLLLLVIGTACSSSFLGEQPDDDARENFEYLWKEVQLKYSFLDYKGIHWDSVYTVYSGRIQPQMSQEALFELLADLTNTLRDGHANLFAPFDYSVYYPTFLNHPENYDARLLLERYFLRDSVRYRITGPFQHTVLDTLGRRIGLVAYRSFSSSFNRAEIDYVLQQFRDVDGVILDLRSNGGGSIQLAHQLAGYFAANRVTSYYSRIKSGPGRNEFTPEQPVEVIPSGSPYRFTGRLAVLVNRQSYSATSMFSLHMRALPQARLVGDSTGGGLGAPNGGELPNGWTYRFSVTQSLSAETDPSGARYNWEDGVPPHIRVDMQAADAQQGFDSIVERAIRYIIDGN